MPFIVNCYHCKREVKVTPSRYYNQKTFFCSRECQQCIIKKCSVINCENKHKSKGYCKLHYGKIQRNGHLNPKKQPNDIINNQKYAEIILRNTNAMSKIDLEDVNKVKGNYLWQEKNGYCILSLEGKQHKLHRYLLNAKPNEIIDHINQDKLDNQKCNLRIVTNLQNRFNLPLSKNNKSGYSGVYFKKSKNRWIAKLSLGNKIKIKSFTNKEEAINYRKKEYEKIKKVVFGGNKNGK